MISPNKKLVLQARSTDDMNDWLNVTQNAISAALTEQPIRRGTDKKMSGATATDSSAAAGSGGGGGDAASGGGTNNSSVMSLLRAVDGNDKCAECTQKDPEWLSLNLGILVCLECSGLHRTLGVSFSRVRSAKLDTLDWAQQELLFALGNTRVNSVYEANYRKGAAITLSDGSVDSSGAEKPKPTTDRLSRERWCKLKYVERAFVKPVTPPPGATDSTPASLAPLLFSAIDAGDTLSLYHALACGADPNWHDSKREHRTALHYAITFNDLVLTECLISSGGARLTELDERRWTPLHTAAFQADVKMIELLLLRGGGSVKDDKDVWGHTPIEVANEYSEFKKDVVPVLERFSQSADAKAAAKAAKQNS